MATQDTNVKANQETPDAKIRRTILDPISGVAQLTLLAGFFMNTLKDFRPDMSLTEAFVRYAFPAIGFAGMASCASIAAQSDDNPRSFAELKDKLNIRTAKAAGKGALFGVVVFGAVGAIQNADYHDKVAKKAEADRVAKLPEADGAKVIDTKTIVIETTLRQKACGFKDYGYVPYKYEGQEVRVNCGVSLVLAVPTVAASAPR